MRLKILGSAGAEFPGLNPPAFLIDESLLLDAGTIGSMLTDEDQSAIKYIFISHSHLDHVRGLPALADNIVIGRRRQQIKVISTADVLAVLKEHLMNGAVWPDFSTIPTPDSPAVSYVEIEPEEELRIDGYTVTAYRVNHPVPAVGYIVRKGKATVLYTGDTGPTDRIWESAGRLSALIVEVSFPNEMEELALMTGHLTSSLLAAELRKLKELPERILISHLKPQFYKQIMNELQALQLPQIELLQDGTSYDL